MPGSAHEGVRLLFQNRPELVRELLARLGIVLPDGALIEDANAFSEISPPTYSADLVVTVRTEVAEASLVIEVQNSIDPEKHYAWPRYAATAHAQRRCATWVVVIATTEGVATWARRAIPTFQPGSAFAPVVIGPSDVPRVTDLETALAAPELAVLSAVMHGEDDDGSVATAAIEAARTLDTERRRLYTDLVYGSLGEVARATVEAIMRERGYEPLTEIGREMLQQGRVEGRVEGRAEGLRDAIRADCELAGIPWTDARAAAVAAMDAAQLEALHAALFRDRAWPTH